MRASFSGVWPPSATITPASAPDGRDSLQPVADVQHVFVGERLEEEAVARVVVGRDGLGVAVDHHGLEAGVAQRERGVHAAVVELDALADAVRTAAEDHDGRPRERRDLVLVLVGAVVVRRVRGELGRARVDRLVGDAHAGREPRGAHGVGVDASQRYASCASEKPSRLACRQSARVIAARPSLREPVALLDDLEDLVEEPRVDAGDLVQPLDRHEPAQRGLDLEDALGRGHRGGAHELVVVEARRARARPGRS